jgi:hypothetical protein
VFIRQLLRRNSLRAGVCAHVSWPAQRSAPHR